MFPKPVKNISLFPILMYFIIIWIWYYLVSIIYLYILILDTIHWRNSRNVECKEEVGVLLSLALVFVASCHAYRNDTERDRKYLGLFPYSTYYTCPSLTLSYFGSSTLQRSTPPSEHV